MPDILLVALLFLFTTILVYGVRCYAQSFLMDAPNHRSSHKLPTPRGGGAACVVVFVAAIMYLFLHNKLQLTVLNLVFIALGVAIIGFWDDHRHIPARWRLLAQLAAAFLAMLCLQGLPTLILPFGLKLSLGWFGYILGGVFLTWMLNLYNFMDGIDGFAASEAVFVASGLGWFMYDVNADFALLAFCLAGVCAGFLLWNWPPAKIFMGDVGSSFIGFLLGVLMILFSYVNSLFFFVGLILFAVFVVDATVTLLRRILSGQKCYEAHCSHAYQHLARRYGDNGHLRVVTGTLIINLGYLLPLAAVAFKLPDFAWLCLFLAYTPLIISAWLLKAGA